MKKKSLYLVLALVLIGGVYFYRKAPHVSDFSSLKASRNNQTEKKGSIPAGVAKTESSVPSGTLSFEGYVPPETQFDDQGAFAVASPPVSRESIVSQFASGQIVNGIAIKANYPEIYDNFKKGKTFKVPTVEGGSVYVIPRRVVVNPDGVSVFIGETEAKEKKENSAAINETNFIFLQDQLIGGQLRINGKVFSMSNGRDGMYLLEFSPKAKID